MVPQNLVKNWRAWRSPHGIAALVLLLVIESVVFSQQASAQARVVGGRDLALSESPSIVGLLNPLRYSRQPERSLFCAGTVISPTWVLTAAHCILDRNGDVLSPESLLISMNSVRVDGETEDIRAVRKIIIHPLFVTTSAGDDIALIELAQAASVAASPLNRAPIQQATTARIAGWGELEFESQNFPDQLQGAEVVAIPGDLCRRQFPGYGSLIRNEQLCAGVSQGGVDTCQGDSGGPLYLLDGMTVAGITSWGNGCANANFPGVYTRVSSYIDWIEQAILLGESPVVEGPLDDPRSGSSGGGSVHAAFLLMLSFVFALRTRRCCKRTRALLLLGLAGLSSGCLSHDQRMLAGDKQAVYGFNEFIQELGSSTSQLSDVLQARWNDEASCHSERTGVGVNRRAYFLERCAYSNNAGTEFCGFIPKQAIYRFLEDTLVMVELVSGDTLAGEIRNCLLSQAGDAGFERVASIGDEPFSITPTSARELMRHRDHGAALSIDNSLISVFELPVVPRVHLLRAEFSD